MDARMTCDFCEKWTAITRRQTKNRLRNMQAVPEAVPYPCPHCGGTYWATKVPATMDDDEDDVGMPVIAKVIGLAAAAVLIAALFLLVMSYHAHGQTFRDASGRQIGTATRDSNGQTTYRDGSGRMTGTSSTNSNGTTTFRDGAGRMTGTAERRR